MHLNAFKYYGGYTNTIFYDNTKQVVLEHGIKASETRFNGELVSFTEYYGITIRLSYPYRPQTKGKIENTIKYLRYNLWAGRTYECLADINVQRGDGFRRSTPRSMAQFMKSRMKDREGEADCAGFGAVVFCQNRGSKENVPRLLHLIQRRPLFRS